MWDRAFVCLYHGHVKANVSGSLDLTRNKPRRRYKWNVWVHSQPIEETEFIALRNEGLSQSERGKSEINEIRIFGLKCISQCKKLIMIR